MLRLLRPGLGTEARRTCSTRAEIPEAVVDLFHEIRTHSMEKIHEFTAPNLFSLTWSFAAAKMLDEKLNAAITARLRSLAMEKESADDIRESQASGNETSATNMAPNVLSKFDHFVCLAKPSGVQVNPPTDSENRYYPSVDIAASSMQKVILDHFGPKYPICRNPEASYGLIHRLDLETTGNLLVATNWWGYYWLRLQWVSFKVLKEYICLTHNHVAESMSITDRIKVNRGTNSSGQASSSAEVADDGRPAFTEVDVLGRFTLESKPYSLLKCRIHTGRTHQIRVHLNHKGYPLVTDSKYSSKTYEQDKLLCARNFLHNFRIAVDDLPDSNGDSTRITLDAPVPDDLRAVLGLLTPQDDTAAKMMNSLITTGLPTAA